MIRPSDHVALLYQRVKYPFRAILVSPVIKSTLTRCLLMNLTSFVVFCSVCPCLVLASQSLAYYPQDPIVQEMVTKGVNYLEGLSDAEIAQSKFSYKPDDHIILVAYAHLKAKHDPNAILVQKGVQRAKQLAKEIQTRSQNRGSGDHAEPDENDKTNYALSIAIILLCEVDARMHESDIEKMRTLLLSRQQPNGGFGYPFDDHGDTSQTQYVVLAIWSMKQNGIAVNPDQVNLVLQWMLRVQDVGGAWPYRAKDPGSDSELIRQSPQMMSHSTALAGASSLLIAADYFGLWRGGASGVEEDGGVLPGMPLAVKLPNKSGKLVLKIDPSKTSVRTDQILTSVNKMNSYRSTVPYERSGSTWHYYSMYSQERFESFFAIASNQEDVTDDWYNVGVDKLKANQHASGGWGIQDSTSSPPPVATAFAILFLVRSTQQSIAANTGTLAGGQGLPKDTTDIKVTGAKISGRPVAAEVGKMLDLLEDDAGDLEGKSIPDDLELADDPQQRRAQLDRLERLLRGSQSWQARRVAARLLGKSEQMRVVPTLIYALSDPDTSVRRYARDGLRFISRKFEGFGLSDQPNKSEIEQAQKLWREWYLRVNPKYVFLQE